MRFDSKQYSHFNLKYQPFLAWCAAALVLFGAQARADSAVANEVQPSSSQTPGGVGQTAINADAPYTPPMGEQPDYTKKYYPTEVTKSYFLELNPLLLLNRGLALESEFKIMESLTLGADALYRDAVIFESDAGVEGRLTYFGLAPKIRFYPLPTLSGVFFGLKVLVGQLSAEISGKQGTESTSQLMVSPVAHVGYRINSMMGATLALYIGGGMNIPRLTIDSTSFPAEAREDATWKDAASQLEQAESGFRPDFGLALGIGF